MPKRIAGRCKRTFQYMRFIDKLNYYIKECANSFIIRRGPDSLRKISIHHGDVTLDLVGSVLSMRPPLTPQPLGNDKGDLLLWNGEVFGGLTVCLYFIYRAGGLSSQLVRPNLTIRTIQLNAWVADNLHEY